MHPKATTIERICSTLLYYITRNTGFEVDKNKFGDCWNVDCCDWIGKTLDDMCGIEETGYISGKRKAWNIFEKSELKRILNEVGINVTHERDEIHAEYIFNKTK